VVDESFLAGFLMARRRSRRGPDAPYVRTVPKMPSRLWRTWAVLCALVPALVVFSITGRVGWSIGAAVLGFAVGMYAVESYWIKHVHRPDGNAPIGRRT
jgi:hypothetical protein